ncbi:hypothetical protein [Mesorhizobium sp. M4A.F.Ca.ET.022.05.2.1]|uniref:hypothetical protein n=1 Tax=Mesorhizobium sp. M4A.F.Ca.ET.022.05.2.1 TaxID=2496653 RepID=UPI001677110D|nr:hypothetical protein [Mesorhizobium sp. M4A.F.Ca.ET.022.05.2.1]
MTYAAIGLLLASAALRTRLVRLYLAVRLLRLSNVLHRAGNNAIESVEREKQQ